MGMYSQICIALNKSAYKKCKTFMSDNKVSPSDNFLLHSDIGLTPAGIVIASYPSVKWYPEYPLVVNANEFLSKLEDGDYSFMEIWEGEHTTYSGELYVDDLYTIHEIHLPWVESEGFVLVDGMDNGILNIELKIGGTF